MRARARARARRAVGTGCAALRGARLPAHRARARAARRYARTPGCFTDAHVRAWRKVTDAVKANGGRMMLQIMHAGRITHPLNQHGASICVAPSAIRAAGQMWTDAKGMQDFPCLLYTSPSPRD